MDKLKEATKWLSAFAELQGVTPEDLDEAVMSMIDRAVDKGHFTREEGDRRASLINNEGLESQVALLIEGSSPEAARNAIVQVIKE